MQLKDYITELNAKRVKSLAAALILSTVSSVASAAECATFAPDQIFKGQPYDLRISAEYQVTPAAGYYLPSS